MDKVTRNGRLVTVEVGGIKATREYADDWCARRAEAKLRESASTRENFFRRPRCSAR